jgi:hypothetical protein
LGGRLCSGSTLRQHAGGAASARNPQKSMDFWRAIQNKTANSYVIEIAI